MTQAAVQWGSPRNILMVIHPRKGCRQWKQERRYKSFFMTITFFTFTLKRSRAKVWMPAWVSAMRRSQNS